MTYSRSKHIAHFRHKLLPEYTCVLTDTNFVHYTFSDKVFAKTDLIMRTIQIQPIHNITFWGVRLRREAENNTVSEVPVATIFKVQDLTQSDNLGRNK